MEKEEDDAPSNKSSGGTKKEGGGLLKRVSLRLASAVNGARSNPRTIADFNQLQASWVGYRLNRGLNQANEFLNEG